MIYEQLDTISKMAFSYFNDIVTELEIPVRKFLNLWESLNARDKLVVLILVYLIYLVQRSANRLSDETYKSDNSEEESEENESEESESEENESEENESEESESEESENESEEESEPEPENKKRDIVGVIRFLLGEFLEFRKSAMQNYNNVGSVINERVVPKLNEFESRIKSLESSHPHNEQLLDKFDQKLDQIEFIEKLESRIKYLEAVIEKTILPNDQYHQERIVTLERDLKQYAEQLTDKVKELGTDLNNLIENIDDFEKDIDTKISANETKTNVWKRQVDSNILQLKKIINNFPTGNYNAISAQGALINKSASADL